MFSRIEKKAICSKIREMWYSRNQSDLQYTISVMLLMLFCRQCQGFSADMSAKPALSSCTIQTSSTCHLKAAVLLSEYASV